MKISFNNLFTMTLTDEGKEKFISYINEKTELFTERYDITPIEQEVFRNNLFTKLDPETNTFCASLYEIIDIFGGDIYRYPFYIVNSVINISPEETLTLNGGI